MSASTLTTATAPSLVRTGAIAGLVAGAANVVVFFVAKAAGVSLEATVGGSTSAIIFAQPLIASFLALLLGGLLLKALLRLGSGITIWSVVVGVVFVAYTGFAVSAAADNGTAAVLTLMHVVGLAVALAMLLPVARKAQG